MRGCEIFRQGRPFDHTVAERLSLRGLEWIEHPARPTLHFLHGIAFCSRLYWPYLRNLTAAGYNLCMHDLEGHGESDLEGEFSGWRLAADRAASVISARRLRQRGGPLIGTGHSYGASLSLILAAEQPDLFDALVLLDPMLMPEQILQQARDGLHQFPLDKTLARRNHWEDAGAAAAYLRSKAAFKDWSDDALDGFIEYNLVPGEEAGLVLRCDPRTEAQVLADPLVTIWDHLREVKVPTVLIHGNDERSPIPANCRRATELNPHIRAVETDGGHNFMQEAPEQSAKITLAVLESIGYSTAA